MAENDLSRRRFLQLTSTSLIASGLALKTATAGPASASGRLLFRDHRLPLAQRIDDLISRLDLGEKIAQLMNDSPAIPRLGIPAYNWWSEACHGVGRNGRATIFPQTIALASSFDRDLVGRIGDAIALEARAKHRAALAANPAGTLRYQGLSFWTPNINLFRDPRWGRGQETFGEDPFLTGELGSALVQGMQGNDPEHLKVAACAKHFAVHSGPEAKRHGFNAQVSPRDLRESYLPHFEKLVRNGVEAVMGAYNRVNGEACCASPKLQHVLREEWGFQGHFLSDCGAIDDFHQNHGVTKNPVDSAALAVNLGCDLNCGCTYNDLHEAVRQGLVKEPTIDRSLRRLLRTKFRLGLFDPPEAVALGAVPIEVAGSEKHRRLAREAAGKGIVMLKNNGVLPLGPKTRNLLVTGPGAASIDPLLGNYSGLSGSMVTLLEGITGRIDEGVQIAYAHGCLPEGPAEGFSRIAVAQCAEADVTIAVLGYLPTYEGEEGDAFGSKLNGDREVIELSACQRAFLAELRKTGRPVVLVLTGGGAIAVPEEHEWCAAVLQVWYPGGEGGSALADVLFGDVDPGGRLPVTVPRATADLPAFEDYRMAGRTYRFALREPLYPFGYGLSYTTWNLESAEVARHGVDGWTATWEVRNTGQRSGRTVVQLYASPPSGSGGAPVSLVDFVSLELAAGQSAKIERKLDPTVWQVFDDLGQRRHQPGRWRVSVGFCSPGERGATLGATPGRTLTVDVV
jgi:beta-glucosidase